MVGALHLLAGPQFGLTLTAFFFTSSKVFMNLLLLLELDNPIAQRVPWPSCYVESK